MKKFFIALIFSSLLIVSCNSTSKQEEPAADSTLVEPDTAGTAVSPADTTVNLDTASESPADTAVH